MTTIRTKRIYEPATPEDGCRVLVDRIWPRGVKRKDARLDRWARELAPSDELRRWFGHAPERWQDFRERYLAELEPARPALEDLLKAAGNGTLTLLFGARDEKRNQAVVLQSLLEDLDAHGDG